MVFRNPCSGCIVEVVCSQECEDYRQYGEWREVLTCKLRQITEICFWYSMWILVMVVVIGAIIGS